MPKVDVPLRSVRDNLVQFVNHMEGFLPNISPVLQEVFRLRWRSEGMMNDFSGFYCVRLVLDDDSPLATQFMDFFSQLTWLMIDFRERDVKLLIPEDVERVVDLATALLNSLQPVLHRCCNLYKAHCYVRSVASLPYVELKRNVKENRMFSNNESLRLVRTHGNINLHDYGCVIQKHKLLGKGAFATVYSAHLENQQGTPVGDPVVLKLFGSNSGSTNMTHGSSYQCNTMGSWHTLMQKELSTLISLRHPNIVDVKGFITTPDVGIVMERMDRSLHDLLSIEGARLGELDMIDLALEIAKGMRFLHESGFIHRDLKPRNVLLRTIAKYSSKLVETEEVVFEEVKVADFGLTTALQPCGGRVDCEHTRSVGSRYYWAPEVEQSAKEDSSIETALYTEKSDVFSFGTTCFNIMTGNPDVQIHTGCNKREFYDAIKGEKWREWVEGCPQLFVDLVSCCWQMEARKRPTFTEICLVLQQAKRFLLQSQIVQLEMLSRSTTPRKFMRAPCRQDSWCANWDRKVRSPESKISSREDVEADREVLAADLANSITMSSAFLSDDEGGGKLKRMEIEVGPRKSRADLSKIHGVTKLNGAKKQEPYKHLLPTCFKYLLKTVQSSRAKIWSRLATCRKHEPREESHQHKVTSHQHVRSEMFLDGSIESPVLRRVLGWAELQSGRFTKGIPSEFQTAIQGSSYVTDSWIRACLNEFGSPECEQADELQQRLLPEFSRLDANPLRKLWAHRADGKFLRRCLDSIFEMLRKGAESEELNSMLIECISSKLPGEPEDQNSMLISLRFLDDKTVVSQFILVLAIHISAHEACSKYGCDDSSLTKVWSIIMSYADTYSLTALLKLLAHYHNFTCEACCHGFFDKSSWGRLIRTWEQEPPRMEFESDNASTILNVDASMVPLLSSIWCLNYTNVMRFFKLEKGFVN